jgi:hypothetical protein
MTDRRRVLVALTTLLALVLVVCLGALAVGLTIAALRILL